MKVCLRSRRADHEAPARLFVAGLEASIAFYERVERTGHPLVEPIRDRPWGLRDFRLVDPDGSYWRVTE